MCPVLFYFVSSCVDSDRLPRFVGKTWRVFESFLSRWFDLVDCKIPECQRSGEADTFFPPPLSFPRGDTGPRLRCLPGLTPRFPKSQIIASPFAGATCAPGTFPHTLCISHTPGEGRVTQPTSQVRTLRPSDARSLTRSRTASRGGVSPPGFSHPRPGQATGSQMWPPARITWGVWKTPPDTDLVGLGCVLGTEIWLVTQI